MRRIKIGLMVMALAAMTVQVSVSGAQESDAKEPDAKSAVNGPRVTINVQVDPGTGALSPLGQFVIETFPEKAPKHSQSFLKLASSGYYTNTTFHRLVPGFIVQGGDPQSRTDWRSPRLGTGGNKISIPSEPGVFPSRGSVVGARLPGKEDSGPQFFICLADLPSLEGHSVFGRVVEGMDVVDKIARIRNAGGRNDNRALQRIVMSAVSVQP